MHDALAVYYFPGMWEWSRNVVQPLAHEAFLKAMHADRRAHEAHSPLGADDAGAWEDALRSGSDLLDAYFEWAPTVDGFTPVRVETDFEVDVPDPDQPDRDLTAADGRAFRFRGRVEVLVVDDDDVYWLVDHRLVGPEWTELDLLVLDEAGITACWAWERCFIGMRIAGVLYNELRIDVSAGAGSTVDAAPSDPAPVTRASGHRRMYARPRRVPDPQIAQVETSRFRRTRVPRSRDQLERMRRQLAGEVMEMTDPALALYPHPTRANCGACAYREPCLAMNEGGDAAAILASQFRERGEELEEGRLGGVTWSMNRGAVPPRFGSAPADG